MRRASPAIPPNDPKKIGREDKWLWAEEVKGSGEDAEEASVTATEEDMEVKEGGELLRDVGWGRCTMEGMVAALVMVTLGVGDATELRVEAASPAVMNIDSVIALVVAGALLDTIVVK